MIKTPDNTIRVNIGCGLLKQPGYVNLDIDPGVKPDVVCDIEEGIPFKDSSVKEIICHDVFQQISTPKKLIFVLNEFWRILEKDGVVIIRVPNAAHMAAFQDPMDIRHFTEETFTYFQSTHHHYRNFGKSYGFKPWKVFRDDIPNIALLQFHLVPVK